MNLLLLGGGKDGGIREGGRSPGKGGRGGLGKRDELESVYYALSGYGVYKREGSEFLIYFP